MKKSKKIKALVVKQPYANQILTGQKVIEFRSWRTHYRGDVLIIAAKKPEIDGLPCGVALGFVDLYAVYGEREVGYEWHLKNVRPLKIPFSIKGKLGIFDVTWPIDE